MDKLVLVKPNIKHMDQAIEYQQEFNGISESSFSDGVAKYNDWLKKLENTSIEEGKVPMTAYFAIRESDNRIIGIITIRHYLNDALLKKGGHIGYRVRPTERRKGYATQMLYLGLKKAKNMKIDKVLLTCDKSNIGSVKTIRSNHGVLEDEYQDENGEIIQRYWVDVSYALAKKGTEINEV